MNGPGKIVCIRLAEYFAAEYPETLRTVPNKSIHQIAKLGFLLKVGLTANNQVIESVEASPQTCDFKRYAQPLLFARNYEAGMFNQHGEPAQKLSTNKVPEFGFKSYHLLYNAYQPC